MQEPSFIDFEAVGNRPLRSRRRRSAPSAARVLLAGVLLAALVTPVAIARPGGGGTAGALKGQPARISVDADGYALRVRNGSSTGMAARMLCANDTRACTFARNLGRGPAAKFVAPNGTPPIDVGGNATKVPGLNADLLDGRSADEIVGDAVQRSGAAAGDDSRFPTSAQKAALAGTAGDPGAGNAYVTDADPRNANARTPSGTASGDLAGTYPGPSLANDSIDSVSLFAAGLRDGAAGTPTLRSLGSGAAQAAAGNDGRFPAGGEKAALSGTTGAPGAGNAYVTDSDPRNTNARTPTDTSVTAAKFATLPQGKMRNTGSQTIASGTFFTQVAFDDLEFGSDVAFGANSLTVNKAGTYIVTAEIYWNLNATGSRGISVLSSATGEIAFDGRDAASTMFTVQGVSAIVKLSAGDNLTMFAGQSSGGPLSTVAIAGRSASLAAQWMGP